MPILAKDTQIGHVYTSQTGVEYLIQEIHPERVVVLKVKTNEIKNDVDPMYGFVAERPIADMEKEPEPQTETQLEPQNGDQNVPGVDAAKGNILEDNREPAESSQPNAAVEPGGVIKNHNPQHPVRRQSPLRRPAPAAAPIPASVPPLTSTPPAKASKVVKPAAPVRKAESVAKVKNTKTLAELEAEEKELLEVQRQATNRLTMIRRHKIEERAKSDPNFLGAPRIDGDPELSRRLREEGVPVKELVSILGQRPADLFFARGLRMIRSGMWAEISISNGLVIVKKVK